MPTRWPAFLLAALWTIPTLAAAPARERLSLDARWRFHLGDPAGVDPAPFDYPELNDLAKVHPGDEAKEAALAARRVSPEATNLGGTLPAVQAGFDDAAWQPVQLPHDWVVGLPFDRRGDESHGFKAIGPKLGNTVGWYRRSFDLPAGDRGRSLSVEFDGVYRNCLVWLNGHCLGRNASGYMGFDYDVTSAANYGGRNELVVRVDASRTEGWFYEGAGIYRHVWLVKTPGAHVLPAGIQITTSAEANGDAVVQVKTTAVPNPYLNVSPSYTVKQQVLDPDGKPVTTASDEQRGPAITADRGPFDLTTTSRLLIHQPRPWSCESPDLYTLVTTVGCNTGTTDTVRTPFGIRTIRFDPDHGFFLNGRHVPINGTCNHQDAAGVGSAIPDALNVWRLEQLKKFGCNAIRTSHNPPTPELLDACDRLGILVMDETRLPGTSPELLGQLDRLVRRDRNHPSVILWSIANEENDVQGKPVGEDIARVMRDEIRKLDDTRPVTAAMNRGWGGGFSKVIDVQGFNYALNTNLDAFHAAHPQLPLFGSEEGSTVSTRGIYDNETALGYVSAYDVNAPPWATLAEKWVAHFAARPYMAGAFVWTGFDYRGEPTPYGWPCINSHFGILDTCGFFKDNAYYYQSVWTDKPMVHLLPHWTWPGREGRPIDVWAYSNAGEVELSLDGHSLGRQPMPKGGHVSWQVPYRPGTLTAVAYRGDAVVASDTVATAGPPARLVLTTDRPTIDADGADVAVVNVAVTDAAGHVVPTASNLVRFAVHGGVALGVGNGDPSCHEPDAADQRSAFNGRCQVIVRSTPTPGPITVTASADGLSAATATVSAVPGPPRSTVP